MAYSKDFRKRAIEYMEKGHTGKELYEAFGIYPPAIARWRKLFAETGSLESQYNETRAGKIDLEELAKAIKDKPSAYLREKLRSNLSLEHAKKFNCTKQAVHYALKRLRISNKKNVHIP